MVAIGFISVFGMLPFGLGTVIPILNEAIEKKE